MQHKIKSEHKPVNYKYMHLTMSH